MSDEQLQGVVLAGGGRLQDALASHGVVGNPGRSGLVYDASASEPQSWAELEAELTEVFRLTQTAVQQKQPIVYVVHEPSIWGHEGPLRSALATALLGGVRSAAVELTRAGLPANAVALGATEELDKAASTIDFLLSGSLTGQTLTCGTVHLGRPAA